MSTHRTFDLTSQPWIPCVFVGSVEPRLCSLRETLLHAHEIREVVDTSPLVSVALHRFLLAVLHRALRLPGDEVWPGDIDAWGEVRVAGHFPADRLAAYLDAMAKERRLDLFGPRPFYQTPKERMTTPFAKEPVTVARIVIADGASNTRPAIFDRSDRSRMTPAEAARNLLALHAYALGGKMHLTEGATVGKKHGLGGAQGALTFGAVFLAQGESLFETLMGNLVVVSAEEPIGSDEFLPAWEAEPVAGYDGVYVPRGYLDLLTHQSRTVLLTAADDGESSTWITGVNIGPGRAIKGDRVVEASGKVMYSRRRAVTRLESVMMLTTDDGKPFTMSADRALWSGAHALFGVEGSKARRSPLGNVAHLAWANQLRLAGTRDGMVEVLCTGIVLKPGGGAIGDWHTERLPLILPDDDREARRDARHVVSSAITEADRIAKALRFTSLTFARAVVDNRTGPAVVDAGGGQSDYWMTLQREFPVVVKRAAAGEDAAPLSAEWSRLAVSTASASLERLLGQLAGDDRRWVAKGAFRTAAHARVSARQELIERIERTGRFAPKKSKGA